MLLLRCLGSLLLQGILWFNWFNRLAYHIRLKQIHFKTCRTWSFFSSQIKLKDRAHERWQGSFMLTWAITFSLSWISDIRILRLPFWLLSIAYDIRGRVRLCANLKISNSIFNFSWEDSMYSNLTVLPPSHLSPECQMYNQSHVPDRGHIRSQ